VEQGTLAVQLQTAPQRFHRIQHKAFRGISVPLMPETPEGLGRTPAAEAGPRHPRLFLIIWIMIVRSTNTEGLKVEGLAEELGQQTQQLVRYLEIMAGLVVEIPAEELVVREPFQGYVVPVQTPLLLLKEIAQAQQEREGPAPAAVVGVVRRPKTVVA
jgi:hypothetical protein